MSLSKEFAQMVKDQNELVPFIHPLLSGIEFSHLNRPDNRCLREYHHLLQWAKSSEWQQLPNILEALHNPSTAIVVTDPGEKIEWVNSGFFRMTGYSYEESIGRNPNFLQGKETRQEDTSFIRKSNQQQKPFTGTLLNYRKNGDVYYCKIDIFPLFNRSKELVNFMAIENEVNAMEGETLNTFP